VILEVLEPKVTVMRSSPMTSRAAALQRQAVQRVINAWRSSPPETAEEIERRKTKERTAAVERLIKASKFLEHPQFDPFQRCGVVPPLERYTRDFLKIMLDSDDFHGMARHILALILDEAAQKNVHSRKAVALIREVCKKDDDIRVEIEFPMLRARPDLVIRSDRFLLAIEIKRRLGVETIVHGKWQSDRLKHSARAYARGEGISPSNVLALFLTPDGGRAHDREVIPVSCQRLFARIDKAITNDRRMKPDTKRWIRSFMDLQTRG
jgi:hypothetical protein